MRHTKNTFFIESHAGGERALAVHVDLFGTTTPEALEECVAEFKELVSSAAVTIFEMLIVKRSKPDVKYFIGSGKAEEIAALVQLHKADVVIFNHRLSPSQERNLEKVLQCRVIDRTGLILDIFAQRARTFEGQLQVEWAQLKHLSTRLVRGWTHLERQKGGIGLRGPGETQLETDRRLLAGRIQSIEKSLAKVLQQRHQNRRARQRADIPTIALVGYTNSGKSTLFNRLTHSEVYAADQLFATLDPTVRMLSIPPLQKVIVADTVGFIRDLPHDLVAAFRATLEETRQADLLLHVIDSHHPHRAELILAVETVLTAIGAEHVPILEIYNKIDLCSNGDPDGLAKIDYSADDSGPDDSGRGIPERVWCSALTGQGLDLVQQALVSLLSDDIMITDVILAPTAGALRAELYRRHLVQAETTAENGDMHLTLQIERSLFNALFPVR